VSRLKRISFVVEGPTDYVLLDALVEHFLNSDDYVPTRIQPPISEFTNNSGPLGGGWKGVLKWCSMIGENPDSSPLTNCDFLIIHIDADIAGEAELASLNLSAECPPAATACDNIRQHLARLIGGSLVSGVILCVPSQCMEAWVLCALHTNEAKKFEPLECRIEVERLLIGRPDRLVVNKSGAAKKQTNSYKLVANRFVAGWGQTTAICSQAERFEAEFKSEFG